MSASRSEARFEGTVYQNRLRSAAAATADAGLAGLIVTPGHDLRYLVGSSAQTFERLTALVIPTLGAPTVVAPRLELASLKESAILELGLPIRGLGGRRRPLRSGAHRAGRGTGGHRGHRYRCPRFTCCRWLPGWAPCRCWPTGVLRRCGCSRTGRGARCEGRARDRPRARPGAGVPEARPHRGAGRRGHRRGDRRGGARGGGVRHRRLRPERRRARTTTCRTG